MATYESKKYATIPIAATQVADGSVTNAEFQFINTVSSNVQTQVDAKAALAGATFTGGVRINDSQNLNIGSGTDLVISHDTNNSKINNTTGELRIAGDNIKLMNQAESETHLTATADGAVGLRHNNVEKLATSATGVTVTGTLAATAVTGDGSGLTNVSYSGPGVGGNTGIDFNDDVKVRFGTNNDLQIYHNNAGSADRIESDNTLQLRTDTFRVQNAAGTETLISANADGIVGLNFNDSQKIVTSNSGVTVSGTCTATTFSGSGASLTSLPAANVTGQLVPSTGYGGITIDYDSLPTSDPNVKGRIYRTTYGIHQVIAVSDG